MRLIRGKEDEPTIAFNAHLDTSPETTGANVRPQVIRGYSGGDIVLPRNPQKVICPGIECLGARGRGELSQLQNSDSSSPTVSEYA